MKKNKAFTLIELLIIIALIGIIAIGSNLINFKYLSDKQRLEGFFYKVKNNIENIANIALLGKNINIGSTSSPNLIVPKKWKIDFNNSGSGKIIINYLNTNYNEYKKIIPKNFFYIKTSCKNLNNNIYTFLNTETGSLIISGKNFSFTGITNCNNKKIIEVKVGYKNFSKSLEINTVSGVININ